MASEGAANGVVAPAAPTLEEPQPMPDPTPPDAATRAHAMPFGTTIEPGGVRFRLWAPGAKEIRLAIEERVTTPCPCTPSMVAGTS